MKALHTDSAMILTGLRKGDLEGLIHLGLESPQTELT